jgi:hypothetical protein
MSIRIVERAVDSPDGRTVGVRRAIFSSEIIVKWLCGDKREFSAQDLQDTIDYLDLLKEYPGVWLAHQDSSGHRFMARIVDGMLEADTTAFGDGASVSWDDLKTALHKAMD